MRKKLADDDDDINLVKIDGVDNRLNNQAMMTKHIDAQLNNKKPVMLVDTKRQADEINMVERRAHRIMRNLARDNTILAIRTLVDCCQNGSGLARIKAAAELLDRGYGKAHLMVEAKEKTPMTQINVSFGDPSETITAEAIEVEEQAALEMLENGETESSI